MTRRDPWLPPAHLSAASRRWFKAIASDYRLEPRHLRILQAAAESWDRYQSARAQVSKEGLTLKDRFGQQRPHPAVAIERDARIAFARLVRELALEDEPAPDARPPRVR